MTKRDELAEAATDYVLEHGLIGLSLRPLAAALGTSDRMLIYHFGSKDELIAAVLERRPTTARWPYIAAHEPGTVAAPGGARPLATYSERQVQRCQLMYVEAAALGLFGREPYASSIRDVATPSGWRAMADLPAALRVSPSC